MYAIMLCNSNILCFHSTGYQLSVNDCIVAIHSATGKFKMGYVLSIEVDHVEKAIIAPYENLDYGMKIDFQVNNNYKFYLIH